MATELDRRIQLRESIHELVVAAAARRCVTPASLVSMVMHSYLKSEGELIAPKPITKVTKPAPAYNRSVWDDEEEEFNVGD